MRIDVLELWSKIIIVRHVQVLVDGLVVIEENVNFSRLYFEALLIFPAENLGLVSDANYQNRARVD